MKMVNVSSQVNLQKEEYCLQDHIKLLTNNTLATNSRGSVPGYSFF
jgi:hypothetical protein